MRSLSILLVGLIGATDALRTAMIPEGPWDRFFPGRNEYYEDEDDEDEGPSGVLTKVLIGAGVAAAGGAGAFAARVIGARRRRRAANTASPSARSSPLGDVQFVKTTGGKSDAKSKPVSKGAAAAAAAAMAPPAEEPLGGAEGQEAEEEEVFEVEEVLTLDESKLTAEQKAHPLAKLLGPKLVRFDEKQGKLVELPTADALKGKTVGLFFHSHQIEAVLKKMNAGQALPTLTNIYKETKDAGKPFEMVFVGLPDGQEGRWQHYVKQMPWLAVPQGATEQLYRSHKVQTFPSVMIVDEEGQVLNDKGFTYMSVDKAGFPWKALTVGEMIGDKFVDAQGKAVGAEAVSPAKAKVLALYFSASWCKPCREFTPRLAELYNKLKAEGKELEVVLVSLDEEEAKYKEYLSEMPWISVPLEDKKRRNLLMTEFEVRSLPTLLLLDEDRTLITARGREFATKDPEGLKFPWRPEPLNEVSYSIEGIGTKPAVCVFMEGASSEAQEKMVGELQGLAEEFAGKAKDAAADDKSHRFGFYYAKEITTISKALRGITGLQQLSPKDKFLKSRADATKPVLVLLDIAGEKYHVSKAETIDEAAVRELVAAQLSGSLTMEAFKQPEPAAGADAAGAA